MTVTAHTTPAIHQRLLDLGFEFRSSDSLSYSPWRQYWHDDTSITASITESGEFHIECFDACAATLPMLVTVAEAMRDLQACRDCGHILADRTLEDFDRDGFDADTWNCCDRCLADDAADGLAVEREYRMAGRA